MAFNPSGSGVVSVGSLFDGTVFDGTALFDTNSVTLLPLGVGPFQDFDFPNPKPIVYSGTIHTFAGSVLALGLLVPVATPPPFSLIRRFDFPNPSRQVYP